MSPDEMTKMLAGAASADTSPTGMSGLSLAFVGDAVYEVMVRSLVLSRGDARVQTLHSRAVDYVNASFQAQAADILLPLLTDDETAVYKRGRNATSAHTPKNKSEAEYHKATGFEALMGYLWLKKDFERLTELFFAVTTAKDNAAENGTARRKTDTE